MSLDIGSILKDEINRKRRQLEQRSNGGVHVETPKERENKSEEKEEEEQQQPIGNDTAVHLENETVLQRLNTRTDRVKKLIADEKISKKDYIIDASQIGALSHAENLAMRCNYYIHELLKQWDLRKEDYKEKIFLETKKSLFPLLVQLRKKTLPRDLLISLSSVLYHLQLDEITQAIESYMKLSIGNVAWPIGVTSVGIHARSAHSKIEGSSGKIANVMLDERTRLWITSIKRLISFKEWLNAYE